MILYIYITYITKSHCVPLFHPKSSGFQKCMWQDDKMSTHRPHLCQEPHLGRSLLSHAPKGSAKKPWDPDIMQDKDIVSTWRLVDIETKRVWRSAVHSKTSQNGQVALWVSGKRWHKERGLKWRQHRHRGPRTTTWDGQCVTGGKPWESSCNHAGVR